MENKQILKVLVGSRSHGLHNESSDYDYRGVFVVPTSRLLSLGNSKKQTSWIEGKIDDTSWELEKFLLMATKSNPSVLEVFMSPSAYYDNNPNSECTLELFRCTHCLGKQLRSLFPHVWNSNDVKNAFISYGHNQRKKFFKDISLREDDPDYDMGRAPKYATAYLRVLYNAVQLLNTGTFSMDTVETPIFDTLKRFRVGEYEIGEVIQVCSEWEDKVNEAFENNPDKETNLEPINEFLLKVRKENW